MDELDQIRRRYAHRAAQGENLYSVVRYDAHVAQFHLERAILKVLTETGRTDFARLRLLEVGCGNGSNLLRMLRWGFRPEHLVANELLPDRLERAREVLPTGVRVVPGDARGLDMDGEFDLVYQSTVFSSILDDSFQEQLAQAMWRCVRPGGAILSYDFAYNNPRNSDVRGVPVRRLRRLFPESAAKPRVELVTLAPPLARRVGRGPGRYAALNAVPWLRTHRLLLLEKPAGRS